MRGDIHEFLNVYADRRCTGYTTALKKTEGIIVFANMHSVQGYAPALHGFNTQQLRGQAGPIFLDNGVIELIIREINNDQEKIKDAITALKKNADSWDPIIIDNSRIEGLKILEE
jgi:hypothetical protein